MIHCYQFREHNIVIDVNSGAIHLVSDLMYQLLSDPTTVFHFPKEDVAEATEEIKALAEAGMLFTDDEQITTEMLEDRGAVIKAMCLHVAHDCNMACRYCFGDTGAFDGPRSLLSLETGKQAIDFLLAHSGTRRNLEIDFFGGEPLLNFDVVKALVAYGREAEKSYGKNIRFTITTNGLLLDDKKSEFINETMDNVILSIDGRKDVNDKMRLTPGGKGTYDVVVNNFQRFAAKRKGTYYVRGTFTADNLDFAEDVRHLASLGFQNISVEPVVTDSSKSYALREEHLPRIFQEYDALADQYLDAALRGEPFSFFHFRIDLTQGPCVVKRVSGCGAGTEYVAVTPEGDLYPCHQFVGNPEFLLGNVKDPVFENRLYDRFNRAHIYIKDECRDCWAKFYCSGGCHANAYHSNDDLLKPYHLGCETERKRLECAIGIQAVLATQA
ncbi:MAG: thioether cross-link-forming SCIFF peptide maturase [Firmicutes bacterium HGW-Firmicutes-11]|jgi:uncharacterized protein|nr:MAG: thioether cross-link-forming SCIFF peptide maturase [Firmicutes bacterium HGW-Firmicutes-11]